MRNSNVFSLLGATNHADKQREKNDFYETPKEAVEELLKYEKFDGEIWECACGKNAIVNVLKEKQYEEIYYSDIIDRGVGADIIDFLQSDRKTKNIITNPPFKLATKFLRKAIELTENKIVLLLRIQFLEGKERYEIFKQHPPSKVYVFVNRVNPLIDGKPYSQSAMCLAWFVWDKSYNGDTIIKWLKY